VNHEAGQSQLGAISRAPPCRRSGRAPRPPSAV